MIFKTDISVALSGRSGWIEAGRDDVSVGSRPSGRGSLPPPDHLHTIDQEQASDGMMTHVDSEDPYVRITLACDEILTEGRFTLDNFPQSTASPLVPLTGLDQAPHLTTRRGHRARATGPVIPS